MITRKSPEQIELMRRAGRLVGMVFEGLFTWVMLSLGGVPMAGDRTTSAGPPRPTWAPGWCWSPRWVSTRR